MTPDDIHNICIALGAKPPKVVAYSNATLVVIRNGDGARVATLLENGMKPDQVKDRLSALYKVKSGNQARQETLDKVFPRKAIQEHQEKQKRKDDWSDELL